MPPGLYGLCAFCAYAGLIDDAAAHAAEEGAERRFKLAPVVWIFGLMAACAYAAEGASAEWGALLLSRVGCGGTGLCRLCGRCRCLPSRRRAPAAAPHRGCADDGRQSHCGGRGLDALFL